MSRAVRTIAANLSLSAWLLIDAVRSILSGREQEGLARASSFMLGAALALAAVFVVRRSSPQVTMTSPWRTAVIVATLALPFGYGLFWTVPDRVSAPLVLLEWIAIVGLFWSIVALGSNFSVLPQVRTLVDTGPYALVRHPIYASYLLLDAAYLLAAPGVVVGLIWSAEAVLLYFRARWEEEVWDGSPAYEAYRARVRDRFVPGLL